MKFKKQTNMRILLVQAEKIDCMDFKVGVCMDFKSRCEDIFYFNLKNISLYYK